MKWKTKKQTPKGAVRVVKSFAWTVKDCDVDNCKIWLTSYWSHQEWNGRKWVTIFINGNAE